MAKSGTPDFGGAPSESTSVVTDIDTAASVSATKVATEPEASVDPDAVKKDELVEKADSLGLATSGTKEDLAKRINEHDSSREHKPEVQYPRTKD